MILEYLKQCPSPAGSAGVEELDINSSLALK